MGSGQERAGAITLLAPVAPIVASPTPQFQWKALAGNWHYEVKIREANSTAELPGSGKLTTATWTPRKPLRPGVLYSWQVVVTNSSGEDILSNSQQFKVLDAQTARQIDSVGDFLYLRGLLYVKAGMPAEAERELQKLKQANPNAPSARTLQQQIRALMQQSQP